MWITDFRVRLEISGVDAFYELLSHLDDLLTACFHVIVLDRCAAVGRFLHLRAIALLRDDAPTGKVPRRQHRRQNSAF